MSMLRLHIRLALQLISPTSDLPLEPYAIVDECRHKTFKIKEFSPKRPYAYKGGAYMRKILPQVATTFVC